MSDLQLRIPLGLGERVIESIFREGRHEYVVFGLVAHARTRGRDLLLLRDVVPLPDAAYTKVQGHGAAWSGSAMLPVIERAIAERLGILLIHAHPHSGIPHLSADDRASAARLLPFFHARVPSRPHGSIVFSYDGVDGLILIPGKKETYSTVQARWFGAAIVDRPPSGEEQLALKERSDALVIGGDGLGRLRASRVAVVGLSGGGSHVVQQLAHLGIGEIVLIDPDILEAKHRSRIVGVTNHEIRAGGRKAEAMERLIRRLATGTRTRVVPFAVPAPEAVSAIADTDVLVGCVDNLHTRADLQKLALRFLIPYVDIGVSIREIQRTDHVGARVSIGGNVITFVPGGFCLWCCGVLSEEKLAQELAGRTRAYFQNRGGEAQVVSFNGVVASQATTEVLQLLTGFAGTGIRSVDLLTFDGSCQRGYKKLNGTAGTLDEWGGTRRAACEFCGPLLGAGDIDWIQTRQTSLAHDTGDTG